MEYQRKKVQKIKAAKPDDKRRTVKSPQKNPQNSAEMHARDVGFDIDDIPMSPKKSSVIHEKNIDIAPKHKDIPIGSRRIKNEEDVRRNPGATRSIKRSSSPSKHQNLQLIIGGKLERLKQRKKTLISTAVILAVSFAILIASLVTPASLIELMQNNFTSWGSGDGMPVKISGVNTLSLQTRNNTAFVLTDTRVCAYNSSGKLIQNIQHGYSNPQMYVSDSRTLVYDRGGMKLRIDTLNTNIANKTLAQKITTATLSDCGKVGIITKGEKSASQLVVSDKTFSKFLAWSSTARLTAVALSRNGKSAAVSAVTSESGNFKSVVYLLDISGTSITQTGQIEFEGVPIVTLETVGNRVIAVGTNTVSSFKFGGGDRVDKTIDYLKSVNFQSNNKITIMDNPSNNIQQTRITMLNKSLAEKLSVTINGNVDYACIADDGIAVINNHMLIMYDKTGNEVSRSDIGYEGTRIASYRGGAVVVSDMQMDYYKYGEATKK